MTDMRWSSDVGYSKTAVDTSLQYRGGQALRHQVIRLTAPPRTSIPDPCRGAGGRAGAVPRAGLRGDDDQGGGDLRRGVPRDGLLGVRQQARHPLGAA